MRKFFQMAAIFFILLSTPVQACADHVFLSEYKQTLFNLGSGLGADEANDVLQTADGYVWVASYSGLLRYDCTDFLRFAGVEIVSRKRCFRAVCRAMLAEYIRLSRIPHSDCLILAVCGHNFCVGKQSDRLLLTAGA